MANNRQVGNIADALIVFADIVDSSKYSAILGYEEYARRLIMFQETFTSLGRRYFPRSEDEAIEYSSVIARGDEGIVFIVASDPKEREKLVFRAIEFLYHLKGLLRFCDDPSVNGGSQVEAPSRFDIGAGIHWGQVAQILNTKNNRLIIEGIEGFAVNYTKRIESASRNGKYSRIVLSLDAAKSLEFDPIILSPFRANMKGIKDDVEVYEVESGLFDGMDIQTRDNRCDARVLDEVVRFCGNPNEGDSPWVKGFAISVLEKMLKVSIVPADQKKYRDFQYALAWHSVSERDPILLYLRSRECRESGERTRELRYLRSILGKNPHFIPARLLLVKVCTDIVKKKSEREEIIFARDTAKEFLGKYKHYLSKAEVDQFNALIGEPRTASKRKVK